MIHSTPKNASVPGYDQLPRQGAVPCGRSSRYKERSARARILSVLDVRVPCSPLWDTGNRVCCVAAPAPGEFSFTSRKCSYNHCVQLVLDIRRSSNASPAAPSDQYARPRVVMEAPCQIWGEILRTETADLHVRLETLPFFTALHAGTLPRISIVSFLRSLSIIHAVLERSLALVSSAAIADLRRHAPPKVPLLVADLHALAAADSPSVSAAIRGALDYAAEILTSGDNPLSLMGVLYVLEASQNGGIVLRHAYSRCLRIPEEQLSYIGCYGRGTAAQWKRFIECLNVFALDEQQGEGSRSGRDSLLRGARTYLHRALSVR